MELGKDIEAPGYGWSKPVGRLARREEVAEWLTYRHVESGYRKNYGIWECACSVGGLHNESVNIWTHLIGLGAWVWVTHSMATRAPVAVLDERTRMMHYALWSACGVMPAASTLAHTFSACGTRLSRRLWKLDFASVVLLLACRAFLEGWLLLGCTRLRDAWVGLSSVSFASLACLAVVRDATWPVVVAALLAHAPLLAYELQSPLTPRRLDLEPGLRLVRLGTLAGALGFLVRAAHVPERWVRATCSCNGSIKYFFDIFGASHQWWHVLTILGPILCALGNERLLAARVTTFCPASWW